MECRQRRDFVGCWWLLRLLLLAATTASHAATVAANAFLNLILENH